MIFPQIRLESTRGQIGLQINQPVQEIQQPQADLSIEQPAAEMTIDRRPSKLTIDQTRAREDVDLKSIRRRIEEAADRGKQDLLDGIARVSSQGDQLMRVEDGGNAIPDIAEANGLPPFYEFNIGFIPSAGSVEIGYDPGDVNIQWQTHKPNIQVNINKPIHHYTPGTTTVSMKQYPNVKVDFENLYYKGINYEQKI